MKYLINKLKQDKLWTIITWLIVISIGVGIFLFVAGMQWQKLQLSWHGNSVLIAGAIIVAISTFLMTMRIFFWLFSIKKVQRKSDEIEIQKQNNAKKNFHAFKDKSKK